jgi:hypothetical protein
MISCTLISLVLMVSCNLNSSTVTTILPGTSKEVGETSTRLPTQQSIPPNGTLSLSTPTQQPQPNTIQGKSFLTFISICSIITPILFFVRENEIANIINQRIISFPFIHWLSFVSVYVNQNGLKLLQKIFWAKLIRRNWPGKSQCGRSI